MLMGGIEEAILQKIDGVEDETDEGRDDSIDEDESGGLSGDSEAPSICREDIDGIHEISDNERLRMIIDPNSHRTGPKGVLADYKFQKVALDLQKKVESSGLGAEHNRAGSSDWNEAVFSELIDEKELRAHAMEKYGRLRGDIALRHKFASEPLYTGIELLKGEADIIRVLDSSPPSTLVVISYYSDCVKACLWLSDVLAIAAFEYPHIRFCKIPISCINEYIDPIALPMLIFYQNSASIGVIVKVDDLVPGWHDSAAASYPTFRDVIAEEGFFESPHFPTQTASPTKNDLK